eukprot:3901474-Rhodomonas_salina.1
MSTDRLDALARADTTAISPVALLRSPKLLLSRPYAMSEPNQACVVRRLIAEPTRTSSSTSPSSRSPRSVTMSRSCSCCSCIPTLSLSSVSSRAFPAPHPASVSHPLARWLAWGQGLPHVVAALQSLLCFLDA